MWVTINIVLLIIAAVFFGLFWKRGQRSEAYDAILWLVAAGGFLAIDVISWIVMGIVALMS